MLVVTMQTQRNRCVFLAQLERPLLIAEKSAIKRYIQQVRHASTPPRALSAPPQQQHPDTEAAMSGKRYVHCIACFVVARTNSALAISVPECTHGTFLSKCRQRCAAMVQTVTLSRC